MDYEQKYKAALGWMQSLYKGLHGVTKEDAEHYFPELKESEDERIKKEIRNFIWGYPHKLPERDKWLAWLEKQGEETNPYSGMSFEYNGHIWGMCARDNGVDILLDKQLFKHLDVQDEQKPTDRIEPKLKIESGKWYVCIGTLLDDYGNTAFCKGGVYLCEKDGYLTPCNSNVPRSITTYCADMYFRNWDISDAKDGDLLVDVYGNIGIYEKCDDFDWVSYCALGRNGGFQPFKLEHEKENTHPATKEQRDLLFQKMNEAGWEWNANKKELQSNVLPD